MIDFDGLAERALIVGDTHCDIKFMLREVLPTAVALNCDHIIQLGDFGYWPNMPEGVVFLNKLQEALATLRRDLVWIDGNHEAHSWLRKIYGNVRERLVMWPHSKISYAPRGSTWALGGVKFMACGGAFSIDRAYRQLNYSWFTEELVDEYDVRVCRAKGKVDVLLTHDAPGGFACATEHGKAKDCPETDENRQRLYKVAVSSDPKMVWHGHWHECQENEIELPRGTVPVIGLGYNTGLTPAMAVLELPSLDYKLVPRHWIDTVRNEV